jgi:hypothetical protein
MERPGELTPEAERAHLKATISETQTELQQTVAEIQDRLSPANLTHQAADGVREAAGHARAATIERVHRMMRGQNPLPYALIGIGAAWLLANNRRGRQWNGHSDYDEYDGSWANSPSSFAGGEAYGSYDGETRGDYQGEGDGRLAQARDDARRRAYALKQQARDRAGRVARQARSQWDHMISDNPMALGIAALAAGAVVGAVLPRTEVENHYMGETRDQLLDSAKSAADSGVETARQAAKETIQKVTSATTPGAQTQTR